MVATPDRALRLVFFGTPAFAVPSLHAALESRHVVIGVVTQPDRPRGRGQQVTESPVKQLARLHDLPVMQPDRLKDEGFLATLRGWSPDLGVVAAYGKILPPAALDAPPCGLINVHASLLPKYRGAAPVHRAVIAGEAETGISIMHVVQALDAGAVYATARRPVGPDDTSVDVEADLARIGAQLLMTVVDDIACGRAHAEPQDATGATYASRLQKNEGVIDWNADALTIHNRVRGLQPWPLAWTYFGGRRLIVLMTRVVPGLMPHHAPAGTVLEIARDGLRVQTGRGLLDLLRVQPEGRRPMSVRDFAAGHPVSAGERFTNPPAS